MEVPQVTDFEMRSWDFLWQNAFRQGKENLGRDFSDSDIYDMASFFADFNVAYIAGRSDRIEWKEEVMRKWEETDSFVPYYFKIVQEEGPNDFTAFDIILE